MYVANRGSIKLSSIAKKGYSVASASGRYTNVTADSVVTVTWKPNKYRIIYNANGGSVKTSTKTVTYGSRCGTLAAPKRKGYDFKGWYTCKKYTSKIASTTYYKTAGNLTLYAKWSKVKVAKSTVRKLTSTSRRILKVSIKKISNASGYVIQYSTK